MFGGILQHEIFGISSASVFKAFLFGLVLLLGIIENLSATGNMLSMERDWVVTAAAPAGQLYDLTQLNASMRRIDLICKLVAPILISVLISATSALNGVMVVGSMSVLSWGVELWCARRVWRLNPRLRQPKILNGDQEVMESSPGFTCSLRGIGRNITRSGLEYIRDLQKYFSATVWVPSLALAFLHLSALSYGATFITYLLSVGFSLDLITIARAAGSIVEISSTLVTPVGIKYLGNAANHGRPRTDFEDIEDSSTALLEGAPTEVARTETGLERLGLWGITWQFLNLVIPPSHECWI
jgi:iron-regulated transporter 1